VLRTQEVLKQICQPKEGSGVAIPAQKILPHWSPTEWASRFTISLHHSPTNSSPTTLPVERSMARHSWLTIDTGVFACCCNGYQYYINSRIEKGDQATGHP